MVGEMILRVKSKIGISRLELSEDSTVGDLKNKIKERIQFTNNSQLKLYIEHNNRHLLEDEVRLSEIGVVHGTSLVLDNSVYEISYKSISTRPSNVTEEIDLNSQPNETTTPPNSQLSEGEKLDGPLFKSFDAYLHENGFEIGDLPLMNSFVPIKIKRGAINKLPKSITIRHQKYRHVDHLEMMNVDEVRGFANFWLSELQMSLQRIGWMYGYYTEDHHYPYGIRAVCEAIYEPPQFSTINDVVMLEDEMLCGVDKIAEKLGLERVGMIFTRLPNECFLTARELMRVIEMQYNSLRHTHYTRYPVSTMVTCTMSPDDSGQPVLNAFMASDLALALYRDELFTSSQAFSNIIHTKCDINDQSSLSSNNNSSSSGNSVRDSVRGVEIGELKPILMESGKEVVNFDTSWLIVRINESAPIKPNSFFPKLNTPFPIENRNPSNSNNSGNSTGNSVSSNGSSSGVDGVRYGEKLLDKKEMLEYFSGNSGDLWNNFHFLIYVCRVLDVDTALSICESIVQQQPIDDLIKELLIH